MIPAIEKLLRYLSVLTLAATMLAVAGCASRGVSYQVGISGGYPYRDSTPYYSPYWGSYPDWQYRRPYPYRPYYYPHHHFRPLPHGFHPRFRRRYW